MGPEALHGYVARKESHNEQHVLSKGLIRWLFEFVERVRNDDPKQPPVSHYMDGKIDCFQVTQAVILSVTDFQASGI